MGAFLVARALRALGTLLGITLMTFLLLRLAPGDPLSLLVGDVSALSAEDLAQARAAYGVDEPLVMQYLRWLWHLGYGDFGHSFQSGRPVLELIVATLPNSLLLAVPSLLLAVVGGVTLGLVAAAFKGTLLDHAVRVFSVAGHAIPAFWLGLLFILGASLQLHWLPVGGMLSIGVSQWDVTDRLRHLVGPVLVLSVAGIANCSRLVRGEAVDTLGQDFVRTAAAKGLPPRSVLAGHVLRNTLLPVVTAAGNLVASLASGAVVVEVVFSWPGMGRLMFDAARAKDEPLVMGTVLFSGAVLLLSYLARDVAYGLVDPRIQHP